MKIEDRTPPRKITELESLLKDIQNLNSETKWNEIAKEIGVEKQIEIHAELLRAIKRIDKELNK